MAPGGTMRLQIIKCTLVLATVPFLMSCSKVTFGNLTRMRLEKTSFYSFIAYEDTILNARLENMGDVGDEVELQITANPQNGEIISLDKLTGEFSYKSKENYFGSDNFDFAEINKKTNEVKNKKADIQVRPLNDLPWLNAETIQFEMNTVNNHFSLIGHDLEDQSPMVMLSESDILELRTQNGLLKKTSSGFNYTPDSNFRGVEQHTFFVKDRDGGIGRQNISLNVGNPFRNLEPAIAGRGMACISCHMKVSSNVIADFGFGDNIFFGNNLNPKRMYGNMYGDQLWEDKHQNKVRPSWETAKITGNIIIPANAHFGYSLRDSLPTGPGKEIYDNARNDAQYAATSLKDYLSVIEGYKASPARIVQKNSIYIGAPAPQTLKQRLSVSSSDVTKYWKNESSSPVLSGLLSKSGYFQNAISGLVCDGDLYINGTLYLKKAKIITKNGCRLYVTGPVFVEGAITYQDLNEGPNNNTNLQITSGRAILLGIAGSHCESDTNPGWYYNQSILSTPNITNPLEFRFRGDIYNRVTRSANPTLASSYPQTAASPIEEGQFIISKGLKIAGLKDASCETGTPAGREIHFERLLLNAPNIQSRYTGKFKGSIIAELPLFALSRFDFSFDPVFQRVPILPLIKTEDFLKIN